MTDTPTLQLLNGKQIDLTTGKVVPDKPVEPSVPQGMVRVPTHNEAQQIVARTRRNIADLPLPPKNMHGIAAVLAYTLFGLTDDEIAIALDLPEAAVERMKSGDAYSEMRAAALTSLRDHETDTVRGMLSDASARAAGKIIGQVDDGDPDVAFRASKDVLDRVGHRPVDVVQHKVQMDSELRIVYIKRDADEAPVIDIDCEEEEEF